MSETNKPNLPVYGLLHVACTLELIDSHRGATAVANSGLVDGRRTIVMKLCRSHPLVARSLGSADTLVIRFLIGLALGEYVLFWGSSHDGSAIRNALKKLAGIEPGAQIWGTAFASRLANCEALSILDTLPIYLPMGENGPFPLFALEAVMKTPSDIPRWRVKGEKAKPTSRPRAGLPQWAGPIEMPEPLECSAAPHRESPPVSTAPAGPSPRALRRMEQRADAAVPVAVPDPRLAPLLAFHAAAKEMLSAEDFAVLEELAKGEPADV